MHPYRFPRKKGRFLVEFTDAGGNHRMSFTRDLSLNGFFVISEHIPKTNEATVVRLHGSRGKVLELPGKVVRIGRSSASGGTAVATGFAFHISGLNDDYMALIDSLSA
ncbi:MAG: PilZ domain-containing protein [Thermoanaerobaculia bacterium]